MKNKHWSILVFFLLLGAYAVTVVTQMRIRESASWKDVGRAMHFYASEPRPQSEHSDASVIVRAASAGDPLAKMCLAILTFEPDNASTKDAQLSESAAASVIDDVYTLAETGNPLAQSLVGWAYEVGLVLEITEKKAIKWYRMAVEAEYSFGMFRLARILHRKRPLVLSDTEAIDLYKRAAENEEPVIGAMIVLGNLYMCEGDDSKFQNAKKWYLLAADNESSEGKFKYAAALHHDRKLTLNDYEAIENYKSLAGRSDSFGVNAALTLGELYANSKDEGDSDAWKWYRIAAEAGDNEGMFRYATLFHGKRWLKLDDTEAIKWYERAAGHEDRPNAEAMIVLGNLFIKDDTGDGLERATAWYRNAANWGNAEGMFKYAGTLHRDRALALADEVAIEWYKRAARHENRPNAEAMLVLGDLFIEDDTGDGLERATAWYRKAANLGNAEGMFKYAQTLHRDHALVFGDRDDMEVMKWYERVADHKDLPNVEAMVVLGDLFVQDESGDGLEKAKGLYLKAAEAGNANGMFKYAETLHRDHAPVLDDSEAIKWYKNAANHREHASVEAKRVLGDVYTRAKPRNQYAKEAFNWYEQASKEGDNASTTGLGRAYENGWGVPRDLTAAFNSYTKAANSEEPGAMHSLGTMFETGRGVSKNEESAQHWYLKAGRAGQADSMVSLGRLYWWGQGRMKKNRVEARKWYTRAAELKHPAAVEWLKNHPSTTTPVSVNWHRGYIEDSAVGEIRTAQEFPESELGRVLRIRTRLQAA